MYDSTSSFLAPPFTLLPFLTHTHTHTRTHAHTHTHTHTSSLTFLTCTHLMLSFASLGQFSTLSSLLFVSLTSIFFPSIHRLKLCVLCLFVFLYTMTCLHLLYFDGSLTVSFPLSPLSSPLLP